MGIFMTAAATFIIVFLIVLFIVKTKYEFKDKGNTKDYVSHVNFTHRDDTFFNTHTSKRKINRD
jgi:hypothetical protein